MVASVGTPAAAPFSTTAVTGPCLSTWYLDRHAISALGLKMNLLSRFGDADDNAAMLVRFPDAMAVLEATWTTFHAGIPHGPIVFGTKGTIVVGRRPGKGLSRPGQSGADGDPPRRPLSCRTRDHRRAVHPPHRGRRGPSPDAGHTAQSRGDRNPGCRNPVGGKRQGRAGRNPGLGRRMTRHPAAAPLP